MEQRNDRLQYTGEQVAMARLANLDPFIDTVQEMSQWPCFKQEPKKVFIGISPRFPARPSQTPPPVAQPLRPSVPKVGRNDPCPCGSGKKYKRCCGA
jgi:preprotein translocase subunit SecA